MELREFEDKIRKIRAENGWRIELECSGIWIVRVYDKETDELLASTGSTGLEAILIAFGKPFDKCPWV